MLAIPRAIWKPAGRREFPLSGHPSALESLKTGMQKSKDFPIYKHYNKKGSNHYDRMSLERIEALCICLAKISRPVVSRSSLLMQR